MSPVQNNQSDKHSQRNCHNFNSQVSPSYDFTKLSPNASQNQQSVQSGNYLINEAEHQQHAQQYSQSAGFQLPAIASIIDGCDSNGHAQFNAFQNTTIIKQQNLIVYCT